jgi:hypothetical protein
MRLICFTNHCSSRSTGYVSHRQRMNALLALQADGLITNLQPEPDCETIYTCIPDTTQLKEIERRLQHAVVEYYKEID